MRFNTSMLLLKVAYLSPFLMVTILTCTTTTSPSHHVQQV